MAKKKAKAKKKPAKKSIKKPIAKKLAVKAAPQKDKSIAIVALILNIVIPGVGSLVGGKTKSGIWQLVLLFGSVFIGIILTVTIIGAVIGIPLMIIGPTIAWIWALIDGIKLVID
jgi:TM2 domain-containing membrane protein YozV